MGNFKSQLYVVFAITLLFPGGVLANTKVIANSVSATANSQNGESTISITSYSNINGQEQTYHYSSTTRGLVQKDVSIDNRHTDSYPKTATESAEINEALLNLIASIASSSALMSTYASTSTTTYEWWNQWLNQFLKYVEKFI